MSPGNTALLLSAWHILLTQIVCSLQKLSSALFFFQAKTKSRNCMHETDSEIEDTVLQPDHRQNKERRNTHSTSLVVGCHTVSCNGCAARIDTTRTREVLKSHDSSSQRHFHSIKQTPPLGFHCCSHRVSDQHTKVV